MSQQTRVLPPAEARAVETVHRDLREAVAAWQALGEKFPGTLRPLGGGLWAEVTESESKENADVVV